MTKTMLIKSEVLGGIFAKIKSKGFQDLSSLDFSNDEYSAETRLVNKISSERNLSRNNNFRLFQNFPHPSL